MSESFPHVTAGHFPSDIRVDHHQNPVIMRRYSNLRDIIYPQETTHITRSIWNAGYETQATVSLIRDPVTIPETSQPVIMTGWDEK